jgi:HEPN domain-containing protein
MPPTAALPLSRAILLQQAMEKSLTALLLRQGWELEKTHDVTKLLLEATKYVAELKKFEDLCERIENYYLEDRYPFETHETGMSPENVARAMQEAQEVRKIISQIFTTSPTDECQEQGD